MAEIKKIDFLCPPCSPRMYIKENTLDDLLRRVYGRLLRVQTSSAPTRGSTKEIIGAVLRLKNPRSRLSRTESKGTVFSCLGELLWYLAGSNDLKFISYYIDRYKDESDDGKTIYGAYGPRIFGNKINQIDNVVNTLRGGSASRRAVIQLFKSEDIDGHRKKEIPCTCSLQFMTRGGKLHCSVHMRSNDAFFGLPHDIFAFTMIQEIIARMLSIEIGDYIHMVGSLHIYDKTIPDIEKFMGEGWQSTGKSMPPMPLGDPWPSLKKVLAAEKSIRKKIEVGKRVSGLDPYWEDLIRLLKVFAARKIGDSSQMIQLKSQFFSPVYSVYIRNKKTKKKAKYSVFEQIPMEYEDGNADV